MSLDYVKFSSGFESYAERIQGHGRTWTFRQKVSVSQMGSFKEVLEEHPMCAGCAMTLFIRLAIIAFPNPEDTITVGTAGCGRLAISQAAIPFVYGNYGDQNGVASGLSRGLRLRFGDKPKDVVVWPETVVLRISDFNRCCTHGSARSGSQRSCWTMKCTGIQVDKKAG